MADLRQKAFWSYREALIINIAVCALQWFILFFANSVSLFADAAHSIADTIVLFGSTFVAYQAMLLPDVHNDHIKRRMTRIAVILLWISIPFILWAAWERIHSSVSFPGIPVILAALVSVVGNILMHRIVRHIDTHKHDHLVRVNLLHIMGDAILSGGVLLSACLVMFLGTGQYDGYIGMAAAVWMTIMGVGIWKQTAIISKQDDEKEHSCHHDH